MNPRLLIILLSVLLFNNAAQGEIYKWKDEQGRIHLTDKPPLTNEAETIKIKPVNSYKTPKQSKPAVKVIIYTTAWCSSCKKAKKYFNNHKIAFMEKDIEKSRQARQEFAKHGGRGVPLILIGDRKLRGFNKTKIAKYLQSEKVGMQ